MTRIVPSVLFDIRRPQRLVERSIMVYRRSWMVIFSGFFEPLFYLFSIRIGLGSLVGDLTINGEAIPYDEFVAPGLLAAAAMNGAIFESTMNVFHKWKSARLYDSLLATPLTPADIALGEIAWSMVRGLMYSAAFLVTMAALGMVNSPWIVMALPASVLIGFAFSAMGMAFTTYMNSWSDFEYVPALTLPLFLFSTTFYPLSTYGDFGWAVRLSPLYHGVALVRAANLGEWSINLVGHASVLVALSAVGLAVTARRIEKLLLT